MPEPFAPEIKTIIDKVQEGETRRDKAVDDLMKKIDTLGVEQIKAAVKKLEQDAADIAKNMVKEVERVGRQMRRMHDPNYDGCWTSEDQARAFGLLAMGVIGKQARCLDSLKAEFPDIHKLAMDSSTDGAFIIPEFSTRLLSLVEQYGVAERELFKMPMGGSSLTFMRRTGGATVYLLTENTAGTETDMTVAQVTLNPQEWGCLTYIPRTLEEDAAVQIGELIAQEYARAFAEKLDDIVFNGDGTATYFGINGIRQRLATVNSVDDGGGLTLATGNAYSEITEADTLKLIGRLPEYAAPRAKHYCSRAFYWNVLVKLIMAKGGVTAMEFEGKRMLAYQGDPVVITQKMPRVEANSQICHLYGDLASAGTLGLRRAFTVEQSREYKFAERQLAILGTRRVAINIHDVGTATEAGPVVGLITAAS